MKISVVKRTNGDYHEHPAVGEIVVSLKKQETNQIKVSVDKKFNELLEEFIGKLENEGFHDPDLEDKLLAYGLNKQEFDHMCTEIKNYAGLGDNDSIISFPFEDWIDRITTITK